MSIQSLGVAITKKPFSFSFSRLKNYETCPRRHQQIDLLKNFKDEESETLVWGDQVHKMLAARLGPRKEELPFAFKQFEVLAQRIEAIEGKLLVEQKYAITENLEACDYFSSKAWFRSIADVAVINPPVAAAIDFKSGKVIDDSVQLALMCGCIFAHYPDVHGIRSEYWWLRQDAITSANFKRSEMLGIWKSVWPRIEQLKLAYETNYYPPKPGGLCKRYCPVVNCEYHGG
jgi:hypothetical protein